MSRICFFGSGNMAEAIIGGIQKAELFDKDSILASDVNRERLAYLNLKYEIPTTLNQKDDLASADIIILSIKPQILEEGLGFLVPCLKDNCLFISILAGTKIESLSKYLTQKISNPRIVRVMPNMAAFVQQSISALCFNQNVQDDDRVLAISIFQSIGTCIVMEEKDLDAVTAVSGSGPAYVFYFLECFQKAAREAGLSEPIAKTFCLETLKGACALLDAKKSDPGDLRKKVTSRGGTTEAAIKTLQEANFGQLIIDAVCAARDRSIELGR